jgi:hypothetical protein
VLRDAQRFFPHLAERTAGLAAGARASRAELFALLAQLAHGGGAGALVAAAAERTGAGPLLAVRLPDPGPVSAILVRRSEPDADHVSLDVTVPWLAAGFAGVNARGLAAAVRVRPAQAPTLAHCAAPALLLLQDCVQRFDRVDAAAEWCSRRPGGGSAWIALADATGGLVAVRIDGRERRVTRVAEGLLVDAPGAQERAALTKRCALRGRLDAATLLELVGAPGDAAAVLDPEGRRLLLRAPGGAARAFGLTGSGAEPDAARLEAGALATRV